MLKFAHCLNLWLVCLPIFTILTFVNTIYLWMGGVAVTLSLFLAGIYISRRQSRIDRVANAYLESLKEKPFEEGLAKILKSGVEELKNQQELNEVFRRIKSRGKNLPNYSVKDRLPQKDLLKFLKFCHKNGFNMENGFDMAIVLEQFKKNWPLEN